MTFPTVKLSGPLTSSGTGTHLNIDQTGNAMWATTEVFAKSEDAKRLIRKDLHNAKKKLEALMTAPQPQEKLFKTTGAVSSTNSQYEGVFSHTFTDPNWAGGVQNVLADMQNDRQNEKSFPIIIGYGKTANFVVDENENLRVDPHKKKHRFIPILSNITQWALVLSGLAGAIYLVCL